MSKEAEEYWPRHRSGYCKGDRICFWYNPETHKVQYLPPAIHARSKWVELVPRAYADKVNNDLVCYVSDEDIMVLIENMDKVIYTKNHESAKSEARDFIPTVKNWLVDMTFELREILNNLKENKEQLKTK